MNRRKFIQSGAMAIVAASVAPAAVLTPTVWHGIAGPKADHNAKLKMFADGGIVHGDTAFVREQMGCFHTSFLLAGWLDEKGGVNLSNVECTGTLLPVPDEARTAVHRFAVLHDGTDTARFSKEIDNLLRKATA